MEILKSTMTDPGFPPEECTYLKVDENTLYYFIKDYSLENGNIIATTNIKEALGHAAYTSLGVINQEGKILIPFENKMIKPIKDQLLLVEKNIPTTASVLESLKNKSDPFALQTLAQNAATIKKQLQGIMGMSGDFVFDNQFSEAALYTMDGINIANQYFSFIGENNGDYYLATNVLGSTIMKFNPNQLYQDQTRDMEPQQDVPPQVPNEATQVEEQQQVEVESNTDTPLTPSIDIPVQNMAPDEQPPIVLTDNQEESNDLVSQESNTSLEQSTKDVTLDIQKEEDEEGTSLDESIPDITSIVEDESSSAEGEEDELDEEDELEENQDYEDIDDEVEDVEEEGKHMKRTHQEEKKDPYNITPEDIASPTILDATNTIKKLLEETRTQRQQIDRYIGEIEALKSTVEIIHAEKDSIKLENQSVTHERDEYRAQVIDLTRENTKLKGAYSRQSEIIKSQGTQISNLKQQVAGMHALSNAINEANVLVQPIEEAPSINSSYQDSNLDIDQYLNGDYNNSSHIINSGVSYFKGKHEKTPNTDENADSYRISRAA